MARRGSLGKDPAARNLMMLPPNEHLRLTTAADLRAISLG
jgi:hypothetical protein